jgi:hypothetical protein
MTARQVASLDPAPVPVSPPATTPTDFGNPAAQPAGLIISEPEPTADENWQVRVSSPGTTSDLMIRFDSEDAARQWSADELSARLQALAEQARKTLRLRRANFARKGGDGQHNDYDVLDGDRDVGCIYLVDSQNGTESWYWGVSLQVTGRNSYGHAGSLEEAKAAFRREYESLKGTQTIGSG